MKKKYKNFALYRNKFRIFVVNKKTIGIMYTYKVKGQTLNVIKITDYNNNNKTYWYYTINDGGADDWYNTKKAAKKAGEEWINENF